MQQMATRLRNWAVVIKRDSIALYLAARDPRTPWYAQLLAALVVAYALSPIDLIPDFIPVLGLLDDLLLVPAGLWLVLRLIPTDVICDCRARASGIATRPVSRLAAFVIVVIWIVVALLMVWAVGAV